MCVFCGDSRYAYVKHEEVRTLGDFTGQFNASIVFRLGLRFLRAMSGCDRVADDIKQ